LKRTVPGHPFSGTVKRRLAMNIPKRGKRYDAEFKADAARLLKESGRSVASVAKSKDLF